MWCDLGNLDLLIWRERESLTLLGGWGRGGANGEKSKVRESEGRKQKKKKLDERKSNERGKTGLSLQVRASSIALSHAFRPLWLLGGIWYEPNHIVLYHVCVRTTLAANLSRGTYNIPNARNFHVTQTRCPLEGTAHAERFPCRIENPVLDGASRNAHSIPVLSKILCHAIFYAMSAQKMSDRELLDLDRKRPRRVVSQWPFGRYAPRR